MACCFVISLLPGVLAVQGREGASGTACGVDARGGDDDSDDG